MAALGVTFGSSTPYAVRRAYLHARMDMEVDAARMDAAAGTIAELLKLAKDNDDDIGLVIGTSKAAHAMAPSGQTDAAVARLTAIEPMALRAQDAGALWCVYSALAGAQLTMGRFEAALESTLKSLRYARDRARQAKVSHVQSLNLLGNVYMAMTNWDKALQVIQEALVMADEAGFSKLKGTLHLNQGAVLGSLGRPAASVEAYEKALWIGRGAGPVGLQGTARNNIRDSYLISKNYLKAEVFAR